MTGFPTVRALSQTAGKDRVLVDGRDVTWFRADQPGDTPMLVPGYTLMEPFAYGSSENLVVVRTNCLFGSDVPGEGDLTWLFTGARVRYERVLDDDSVVTDYRGVITGIRTSGREWVAEVGGEVAARAAARDRQQPLVRGMLDLGRHMYYAARSLGLHMTPNHGPDTGLTGALEGGVTLLGWMAKLGALSRTAGQQARALMPTVWGGDTWAFAPKDITTKDFTVYADGQRIGVDLVDDALERPNVIYGSGVKPNGERFRGARYSGFFQGPPSPYPMAGGATFTVGTTDADTLDGFGITRLRGKLAQFDYLSDTYSTGATFDARVAAAVNRLKKDAGLTQDGVVGPVTWAALWDTDVVGYTAEGSRIFPLAQDERVRKYNYSPTGGVLGPNPNWVPGFLEVDRTIDFGVVEKADAIAYCERLVQDANGAQWAGSLSLNNSSVFSGEHDGTDWDDLTADDILPGRDIRPGMNAWLPYFAGGTLLHVSVVTVSAADTTGARTITLTADSASRDAFDLTQALARNADSRRNIYREWLIANRGLKPAGNFISRDEYFGKNFADVPLIGGQWNVVEVIMGQSGTVARTTIELADAETEFCVAVFAKTMTEAGMNGYIGDPFSVDGDGNTVWEHEHLQGFFEDRLLLFLSGKGDQPCGYGWRKGYNADGDRTTNPLTGTLLDDSSWSYHADPTNEAIVYMAIWPVADCTLQRGQLFYALEDDVT